MPYYVDLSSPNRMFAKTIDHNNINIIRFWTKKKSHLKIEENY